MSFTYLASPYTSPSTLVRLERYHAVKAQAASFARLGFIVYSPIVHWHQVAVEYDLPHDEGFWWKQNVAMLSRADKLLVLTLPGWEDSRGVQREIRYWRGVFGEPELVTPTEKEYDRLKQAS